MGTVVLACERNYPIVLHASHVRLAYSLELLLYAFAPRHKKFETKKEKKFHTL